MTFSIGRRGLPALAIGLAAATGTPAARAPGARKRLFFGTYMGGHMFYLRTKSRAEMAADVREFLEAGP